MVGIILSKKDEINRESKDILFQIDNFINTKQRNDSFFYRNQLIENSKFYEIYLEDLFEFDQSLFSKLVNKPLVNIQIFEDLILKKKKCVFPDLENITIRFNSDSSIYQETIDKLEPCKLSEVSGYIMGLKDFFKKKLIVYKCPICQNRIKIPQGLIKQHDYKPNICPIPTCKNRKDISLVENECISTKYQYGWLKDNEDLSIKKIKILIPDYLVGKIYPGDFVRFIGICRLEKKYSSTNLFVKTLQVNNCFRLEESNFNTMIQNNRMYITKRGFFSDSISENSCYSEILFSFEDFRIERKTKQIKGNNIIWKYSGFIQAKGIKKSFELLDFSELRRFIENHYSVSSKCIRLLDILLKEHINSEGEDLNGRIIDNQTKG